MAGASAPGALELVQAFINTVDLESGTDEVATPETMRAWLAERGLLSDEVVLSPREHERALAFREALRDLLSTNDGHMWTRAGAEGLTELAAGAPLRVAVDADGGVRLVPVRSGVDGAIGRLLAIVVEAAAAGTLPRLKVCRDDVCRWAFWDSSKNRTGTWCSMAVCGNRAKVRAYQQRRRAASPRG